MSSAILGACCLWMAVDGDTDAAVTARICSGWSSSGHWPPFSLRGMFITHVYEVVCDPKHIPLKVKKQNI